MGTLGTVSSDADRPSPKNTGEETVPGADLQHPCARGPVSAGATVRFTASESGGNCPQDPGADLQHPVLNLEHRAEGDVLLAAAGRLEFPLADGFHRLLIEAEAQAAKEPEIPGPAVG